MWGLTILTTICFHFLLPAALLAYSFGLRHAVDADHISAIDNVTRKLMRERKMYPVGFVFGLGFETATEITLLAISGSFTAQHVPFFVVLLLPVLFTAGMSIVNTTDGVLMLGAYS